MTSFDSNEYPSLIRSEAVAMRDSSGLIKAHFKDSFLTKQVSALPTISLSELDQAFIFWGIIAIAIFSLAQFSPLGWTTQAFIDAILTSVGIASTSKLTWRLASSESLRWVIFLWAGLMSGGMALTAYSIVCGVGIVLMNLSPLWLGLCSLGYLAMGVGLRSRSFTSASLVHGLAIFVLPFHPGWQFLISGLVMALTLFFFSVVPWDMRAAEADELCGMRTEL